MFGVADYWDKKVSKLTLFRLRNPNMLRDRNLRTNQNYRLHALRGFKEFTMNPSLTELDLSERFRKQ